MQYFDRILYTALFFYRHNHQKTREALVKRYRSLNNELNIKQNQSKRIVICLLLRALIFNPSMHNFEKCPNIL